MNIKLRFALLLICLVFLRTANIASGATVDEIIVFHDMDAEGIPIANVSYPNTVDYVRLWVRLSDVQENDTVTVTWTDPVGNWYSHEEVQLPPFGDGSKLYSFVDELKVSGEAAAEKRGSTWTVGVRNEHFEGVALIFDIHEAVRGTYYNVLRVTPVGSVVIGEPVTVEVVIEYNVIVSLPILPSIYNESLSLVAYTSDEILGEGERTYTLTVPTGAGDDSRVFYAVANYYVDGEWRYNDPGGYMAFTLSGDSTPSEDDKGIDFSSINVDQLSEALNNTLQEGLDFVENLDLPNATDLEETIREKTGIPGFPFMAILLSISLIAVYLRNRE